MLGRRFDLRGLRDEFGIRRGRRGRLGVEGTADGERTCILGNGSLVRNEWWRRSPLRNAVARDSGTTERARELCGGSLDADRHGRGGGLA